MATMVDDEERQFNQSNIDEFRRNGGKVGGQFEGFPLLLLTSTGARSGAQRTTPVAYFDIDGHIYVVGSSAGRDRDPAWVFNIRAQPAASVEIGADPRAVTARELPAPNAIRCIARSSSRHPASVSTKLTDRVIPVFELVPAWSAWRTELISWPTSRCGVAVRISQPWIARRSAAAAARLISVRSVGGGSLST